MSKMLKSCTQTRENKSLKYIKVYLKGKFFTEKRKAEMLIFIK